MKSRNIYKILLVAILLFSLAAGGGAQKSKKQKKSKDQKAEAPQKIQLDRTIGDLAEAVAFNPIPVKGIGLVVGLQDTGSSECPPAVRDYLRQYILTQVGRQKVVNPDAMINSKDTAVVFVEGLIPAGAVEQEAFNIKVQAMPNTQTTSLVGGRLYTTDLKLVGRVEEAIATSRTLALAAGTVYIDNITEPKPDQRIGFVLGGGRAIENHQILLALFNPDFRIAAIIRNRINERFGRNVATATSENTIYLSLPENFKYKKVRFIKLVKALYITSSATAEDKQINSLIEKAANRAGKDKI